MHVPRPSHRHWDASDASCGCRRILLGIVLRDLVLVSGTEKVKGKAERCTAVAALFLRKMAKGVTVGSKDAAQERRQYQVPPDDASPSRAETAPRTGRILDPGWSPAEVQVSDMGDRRRRAFPPGTQPSW